MINEAKAAARRKGAFIMMVEQDLMLARFLAGLHSHKVTPSPPPFPPPPALAIPGLGFKPPDLHPFLSPSSIPQLLCLVIATSATVRSQLHVCNCNKTSIFSLVYFGGVIALLWAIVRTQCSEQTKPLPPPPLLCICLHA